MGWGEETIDVEQRARVVLGLLKNSFLSNAAILFSCKRDELDRQRRIHV